MKETGQIAESSPKPLGEIFGRPGASESEGSDTSPSPKETEPSSQAAPAEGAQAPAEEKKVEAEVKADGEQAKSKVEVEAKPAEEKAGEKTEAIGDAGPTIDWESEENPFKQKFAAIEKQYQDTRAWARNEGAQRQKLQQQLDIINKKLDGTYDPDVDDPKPDPQAVILQAQAEGKMLGSLDAAYLQYGKGDKKAGQEHVDKEIVRYNELFAENSLVQNQVWSSPAPVFAALKVLRDFDISQKYGTTDAAELIEKVKAEHETELEKKLTEKITKQVLDGIAMKNKIPAGINGARAAVKIDGEKPPVNKPLSALFTN